MISGHRSAAVGLLALALLAAFDILADVDVVPGVLFVVVPLAVALRADARDTAVIAAVAVPLVIAVALTSDVGTTARWILSVCGVAAGGMLAVWLAELRVRAQAQTRRLQALSQVERELTAALGSLGEAVTIADATGHIVYANQAAVELLRVSSAEELMGPEVVEVMDRFIVTDEHGAPVGLEQLPGSRLLAGEEDVAPIIVRNVVRATGEERWLLNKATVVPGRPGTPRRVANVIEDLTELKRAELQNAELAATLQRGILPPLLPVLDGWSAAALYHPAGEIGEVGGDFFDAFRAGDDWMVVIGDVAGHGPDAATLTALARYTLRTAAELTGDPAAALAHLNRSLRTEGRLSLCTAACVRLSQAGGTHVAAVASAGHPLPMLVRDGAVTDVGRAGPLTGAFDDEGAWPVETVELRPADVLVLYTDGVLDALSHRGRRGTTWMHPLLSAEPATAHRIIARLDSALAAEPDERRRDDNAAVALELVGTAVPSAP
jgi:sigma-B regulation protein RsbU (phosphoserine phosphatase)